MRTALLILRIFARRGGDRGLVAVPATSRRPGRRLLTQPSSKSVPRLSEEVGSAKPEHRIFEVALAQGHALPSEAVMVGDDPRTDVAGAKAAGLYALWVNRGGREWYTDIGCAPDGVATDLAGIVAPICDL